VYTSEAITFTSPRDSWEELDEDSPIFDAIPFFRVEGFTVVEEKKRDAAPPTVPISQSAIIPQDPQTNPAIPRSGSESPLPPSSQTDSYRHALPSSGSFRHRYSSASGAGGTLADAAAGEDAGGGEDAAGEDAYGSRRSMRRLLQKTGRCYQKVGI
jgi:hypothetical protein